MPEGAAVKAESGAPTPASRWRAIALVEVLGVLPAMIAGACAGDDAPGDGETAVSTAGGGTTVADGPLTTQGPATRGESDGTTAMGATDAPDPDSTDGSEDSDTGADTGDTGVPSDCGNGMLDEGEACDEANGEDADGCNEDCTVSGSILWSHAQATGLGADDLYGIALDADGNAYVGGGVHNSASSGQDHWVRQYTADGGLGWTASVAGTGAGNDAAMDVAVFGDAVLVAGRLVGGTNNNWRVTEYAVAGGQNWADNYGNPIGGSDVAEAIAVDSTGAAYIAGREAVFEQGQNIRVRQYLPGGGLGWEATLGGVGDQRGLAIAVDFEGNVIAGGFDSPTGQGRNGWIRKYSPTGAVLWTHAYAGEAALSDQVNGLATDGRGNIVAVGTEGTAEQGTIAFARRLAPDGSELWTQTWPGQTAEPVAALDVAIDSVGHIVMVGTQEVGGVSLGMVRKYDADGTVRWSETYATEAGTNQAIRAVTTDADTRIWVAGSRDVGIDASDAWVARLAQ